MILDYPAAPASIMVVLMTGRQEGLGLRRRCDNRSRGQREI